MKRMKERACSICHEPLKWWNTQSCMKCGHTICKRHTRTVRRSRSSVLFSLCTNCALNAAKRRAINPTSLPGVLRTNKTVDSLLSSLSGISFSGISFSGISFSGIKREQPQSNDQPDLTDTSQTEQSGLPSSGPETPLPEQHQDDEQTD